MLVEGYRGGLLQDLENKRLYSIDHDSKALLSRLINGEEIQSVLKELNKEDKENFTHYIQGLVDKNLGTYSHMWIKSEKLEKRLCTSLDTVWLELRKSCNLRCCHCYMDSNIQRENGLDLLSFEEWISIIDQLKVYGPKKIILIGGEPLIFKELIKLIYYIGKNIEGCHIVLYSNLTLIEGKLIQCLKENKVKVITSLYSNEAKVHDRITGQIGSHEKTVSAIKLLKQNQIYINANTVIMKYNCHDIEAIEKYIYSLTGKKPKFDVIRNIGSSKDYLMPPEDQVNNKRKKLDFKGISKDEYIRNLSGNSCWQGKLNITCDGYVSPCIMGESFIDRSFNMKKHTIDQIINNYLKLQVWNISKDNIEVCKDCEYRYVCKDCRPICAEKDNIYAKDKKCTYDPYKRSY